MRGAGRGGQGEGAEHGGAGLQETAAADDRTDGAGGSCGGRHVRAQRIDPDALDERARAMLNVADPADLVLPYGPGRRLF